MRVSLTVQVLLIILKYLSYSKETAPHVIVYNLKLRGLTFDSTLTFDFVKLRNFIHFFFNWQKPIMLHGHERPVTKIKYNREGDLIFSASKDKNPNVWYSLNGERLGTFNGHNGSVWCIDVNWDTTRFLSGSGDNTLRVWDCQTGK